MAGKSWSVTSALRLYDMLFRERAFVNLRIVVGLSFGMYWVDAGAKGEVGVSMAFLFPVPEIRNNMWGHAAAMH